MKHVGTGMRKIGTTLLRVVAWYLSLGFGYGLWVMIVLQFKACGMFASCPDLPSYPSTIVNVLLTVLPDALPYSVFIAIGRGITWLPNLLLALSGFQGASFMDWLLVRDAPTLEAFYTTISRLLP